MKKMIMVLTVSIIIFFGFLFFSESEFLINNKKITPDKSENILPQGKITQYNSTGWRGIPLFLNGTGYDPDGIITLYEWDFNGDGKYDWNSTVIGTTYHTYNKTGFFNASFRITDNDNGIVSYTLKVEIIDLIYSTPDIKIFGDWNENTVSELIYINGTTSNDNLNDSLLNIFLLIGNSSYNCSFSELKDSDGLYYKWNYQLDTKYYSNGVLEIKAIAKYKIGGEVSNSTSVLVSNYRNFTLYISNQDDNNDPINIKISLDNCLLINDDFYYSDEQGHEAHNWIKYEFNISCGTHSLTGIVNVNNASLDDTFLLTTNSYGIVDFYGIGATYPGLHLMYFSSKEPMFI